MQRPHLGVGASLRVQRRLADEDDLRRVVQAHEAAVHAMRSALLELQRRRGTARGHDAATLAADIAAVEGQLAETQREHAAAVAQRRRDMVCITEDDRAYIRAFRAASLDHAATRPDESPLQGDVAGPARDPTRDELVLFVRHFTQYAAVSELAGDARRDGRLLYGVLCQGDDGAATMSRVARGFFPDLSAEEADMLTYRAYVDPSRNATPHWFHAACSAVLPVLQSYATARPSLRQSRTYASDCAAAAQEREVLEERFRVALANATPADAARPQAHSRRLRDELLRRRFAARCQWAQTACVAVGQPAPVSADDVPEDEPSCFPRRAPRKQHSVATEIAAADVKSASLHDAVLRAPLAGGDVSATDAAELRALFRAMADGGALLHPRQLAEVLTLFSGDTAFSATDVLELLTRWGVDGSALTYDAFLGIGPRLHALAWDAVLFGAMDAAERRSAIAAKRALNVPLAKYELRFARSGHGAPPRAASARVDREPRRPAPPAAGPPRPNVR